MRFSFIIALCLFTGCRGPTEQQIAGTGLQGAAIFAVLSWSILSGIVYVAHRIRYSARHPVDMRSGVWVLLASHALISVIVIAAGESLSRDLGFQALIWACAAANHLTWSILIWRLGNLPPARAALLAGIPCLLLGLPGALGSRPSALAVMLQWAYGGMVGIVPGVLTLGVWLEAMLRRESPKPE